MADETQLSKSAWTQVVENDGAVAINVTLQPQTNWLHLWRREAEQPSSDSQIGFRWLGSQGMLAVDLQPGSSLWMRLDASCPLTSAGVTWEA